MFGRTKASGVLSRPIIGDVIPQRKLKTVVFRVYLGLLLRIAISAGVREKGIKSISVQEIV